MMFRYVVCMVVLSAALFSGGCARPAATVDGKGITKQKLDLYMKDRLQQHKSQNAAVDQKKLRDAILQELIGEQLTLNEAAAKGIKVADADVDKEIDAIRKRLGEEQYKKNLQDKGLTPETYKSRLKEMLTIARFIESLVKPEEVTEQQMSDYYKQSQKPFLKPARFNMKIVEFQTEEAARNAAAEIKKTKADFDEYAKKLGADKKASVTDYGWVSPDFFSPSMASAIKMLKDGQNGGPYQGKTGFYLVRVKERQNESIASFEDVKDSILASLLQQRRNDLYMHWLEQKRKTAKIVVNVK